RRRGPRERGGGQARGDGSPARAGRRRVRAGEVGPGGHDASVQERAGRRARGAASPAKRGGAGGGRRRTAASGGSGARRAHGGEGESRQPGHRSEEHTSELQSRSDLVCRLLLEKKKKRR